MTLPFGIDISKYQNPDLIDYDKTAEKVDFVILRIGFGWAKDIYFERHYLAFTERGVRIGVYHFPLNTRLQEQANLVKQALDGKRIEVGLWVDVEAQYQSRSEINAYRVLFWDNSAGALKWLQVDGIVDTNLGVWQSYKPTWTASTTNPTLGNGILNGRYTQVGKLVTCNLYLQMGSTTRYGSGAWSFSLPKTAASVSTPGIGNWTGYDANGLVYCGQVLVAYGVSAINGFFRDGISNGFTPSVPFTWASGDVLQISAAYEIA